jgi:hypothetical protein
MSYLRMSRFVCLDAGDHLLKDAVICLVCERSKPDELKVRKTCLQDKVRRNMKLDRILSQRDLVKEMPGRDGEPVIRVIKEMRPVKLRIPPD